MALIATYAKDRRLAAGVVEALEPDHDVARSPSWEGFERLVRERPVTGAVVDLESLGVPPESDDKLLAFRRRFPALPLVAVVRSRRDPLSLFRVGREGIDELLLLPLETLEENLDDAVRDAMRRGPAALVVRALSAYLPLRELTVVRTAMDEVHRRWSADDFAERIGYTRPHLSVRLDTYGIPSVGHLLLWVRLLHAGYWLPEQGRSGQSVSRQLEYSSGAAFRRALKEYTGATPTEVIEGGGFSFVLRHFLLACGIDPEGVFGPGERVA